MVVVSMLKAPESDGKRRGLMAGCLGGCRCLREVCDDRASDLSRTE